MIDTGNLITQLISVLSLVTLIYSLEPLSLLTTSTKTMRLLMSRNRTVAPDRQMQCIFAAVAVDPVADAVDRS